MGESIFRLQQASLFSHCLPSLFIATATQSHNQRVQSAEAFAKLSHARIMPTLIPKSMPTNSLRQAAARRSVAQHTENAGQQHPCLLRRGLFPFRLHERQATLRVAQQQFQPFIVIGHLLSRLSQLLRTIALESLVGQHTLRQIALLDQMTLNRLQVDLSGRASLLHAAGAQVANGIALVLQAGLHTDHWHGIPMGTGSETGGQNALQPLRQEAAQRHIGIIHLMPSLRWIQGEIGVNRHAMGIERALVVGDRVGIAAMPHHVIDRNGIVAHHPPTLTGLRHLHDVELRPHLRLGLYEGPRDIEHIRVIHKEPVIVVVVVTRCPFPRTGPLNSEALLPRIFVSSTCGDGDVGATRTVDHQVGQDDTPSERCGHHQALHPVALRQGSAAHHAEPKRSACLQQLPTQPLHLPVSQEMAILIQLAGMIRWSHAVHTLIHLGGEAIPETIPIDTDHTQGTESAQSV